MPTFTPQLHHATTGRNLHRITGSFSQQTINMMYTVYSILDNSTANTFDKESPFSVQVTTHSQHWRDVHSLQAPGLQGVDPCQKLSDDHASEPHHGQPAWYSTTAGYYSVRRWHEHFLFHICCMEAVPTVSLALLAPLTQSSCQQA